MTIRRRKPCRVARRSFHPGILGLGGAGEEIRFTGCEKERFPLVGRSTRFCIGAGPVSDGVVEVDPFVFDQTHGDGWPVGFRASVADIIFSFFILFSLEIFILEENAQNNAFPRSF